MVNLHCSNIYLIHILIYDSNLGLMNVLVHGLINCLVHGLVHGLIHDLIHDLIHGLIHGLIQVLSLVQSLFWSMVNPWFDPQPFKKINDMKTGKIQYFLYPYRLVPYLRMDV